MRILITGATGFVGSWVARYLVDQGHELVILRRKSSDISELEGLKAEHRIGDVTDLESLLSAAQDVDNIFHLAGVVGYSPALRPMMEKVNVGGTAHVIETCRRLKLGRLLYVSSVVAIGASFDRTPLNESSPYNLSHLNLGYFETKHYAENLVLQATLRGDIDAAIVNPSTIYGPGDAKKGSRKVQLKVAKGKFPFYTSGGVNVISIHDLVPALYQAWKIGKSGERYILAGENLLIKDLFALIAKEAGVKPPGIYLPDRVVKWIGKVGDELEMRGKKGPLNTENAWTSILYHWFDSSKAQKELGLKPRPAAEAIKESVNWVREHGLLK